MKTWKIVKIIGKNARYTNDTTFVTSVVGNPEEILCKLNSEESNGTIATFIAENTQPFHYSEDFKRNHPEHKGTLWA